MAETAGAIDAVAESLDTGRPGTRCGVPSRTMDDVRDDTGATHATPVGARGSKAERRAARQAVGAYHESELGKLLEHVRDGFAQYDAGEIDAFDLDDLIHRYKRSAQKLWSFCTGSSEHVARMLDWMREQGDETDWWKAGEPRRR